MTLTKIPSLALALGLSAGLAAASSRASDSPQAPVKLAGTWKLNKELSDDLAQKMRELRSAAGSERGGGGGGMGGHGGGGMGGHGGGGGGGMGGHGGGGGGMGGHGGGGGYGGGRGGGGGERPGGSRGPGSGGAGFLGGEPPLDGATGEERPQGQESEEGRGQRRPMLAPSPQFSIDQDGDVMAFRTAANLRLLQTDGKKAKSEGPGGKIETTAKFLKDALVIEAKAETGGKRKETYTILQDGKLQADFDFEGFGRMPALKFKLIFDAAPATQF